MDTNPKALRANFRHAVGLGLAVRLVPILQDPAALAHLQRGVAADVAQVPSKPGWIRQNERRPNTYDDAAIVIDDDGRRRLMSVMSTMDPFGDWALLRDLAAALDAVCG